LPPIPRSQDKLFYGWVIVITFLVSGTILWGTRLSFGVFFKSIAAEFDLTRAATSSVFSIQMLFSLAFSILGGWAADKYGPRIVVLMMGIFAGLSLLLTSQINSPWQLFITYSFLLAAGTGAVFSVAMSTVSRWFDKKRGLAMGFAGSGNASGTMVMAPFATYLIAIFDWRMAYIVMGLLAWVIVMPLSRLLRRDPYEIGALPDGVKSPPEDTAKEKSSTRPDDLSLAQVIRTRSFWSIIPIFLFYAINQFLIATHLVPHITDIGFSAAEAATVLSLLGGIGLGGRVLLGAFSDRIGRQLMSAICLLIQTVAMAWLIWAQELWMFYVFALIYGFGFGGFGPAVAALAGDIFGLRRIGTILGVLDIGFGTGAAIGPVIGGLIFDVSNSYFLAFLIGAVALAVASLLTTLVRRETTRNP